MLTLLGNKHSDIYTSKSEPYIHKYIRSSLNVPQSSSKPGLNFLCSRLSAIEWSPIARPKAVWMWTL